MRAHPWFLPVIFLAVRWAGVKVRIECDIVSVSTSQELTCHLSSLLTFARAKGREEKWIVVQLQVLLGNEREDGYETTDRP